MLASVRLENWRGHEDTMVPLSPFTVLVGGNGVGKSTVLEAIADVSRGIGRACISELRANTSVVRRGAERARAYFHHERGAFDLDRVNANTNQPGFSPDFQPDLQRGAELSLSPRRIAEPSPVSKIKPDFDGFGTASTLAHLKLNDLDRFSRVLDRARRIVSNVQGFGLTVTSVEELAYSDPNGLGGNTRQTRRADGYALDVSFDNAPKIPAAAVSEGTLLAIGALTAIEAHDDTRTLLIDDLDRALHVEAQAQYVHILREIQKDNPELQIIATTHSPLVVEHFTDDEVVVLGRDRAGKVVARRLSEHPKRAKIRTLSAGEFWIAELERWVAP
jgi:energy-coupling factor transporter ATP-binding protein EcfA2